LAEEDPMAMADVLDMRRLLLELDHKSLSYGATHMPRA
jgi:hypothetical protein